MSRRDLISSADTIMQMAQCCDAVCSNIRDMQARQTPTPSCFAHASYST